MNALDTTARGSSLIEVLVAMFVLATGILGINALQIASLKTGQNSLFRTQAVFHAQDLLERMRSNIEGMQSLAYDAPTPAMTASCLSSGCSAAQLAAFDVAEWQAGIAASLPGGAGSVCIDADTTDGAAGTPACDGNGSTYAITIWWDDDRDGAATSKLVMTLPK